MIAYLEMGFTGMPTQTIIDVLKQQELEIKRIHPVKELDEQFKKGFEAGKEEGWKAHKFHHPVKKLTDEEINKLWAESHEDGIAMQQGFTTQQHYFAHLLLRKAQEK